MSEWAAKRQCKWCWRWLGAGSREGCCSGKSSHRGGQWAWEEAAAPPGSWLQVPSSRPLPMGRLSGAPSLVLLHTLVELTDI